MAVDVVMAVPDSAIPGGIGYVENAYATQNKLITTQLRNKGGQFVEPSMAA